MTLIVFARARTSPPESSVLLLLLLRREFTITFDRERTRAFTTSHEIIYFGKKIRRSSCPSGPGRNNIPISFWDEGPAAKLGKHIKLIIYYIERFFLVQLRTGWVLKVQKRLSFILISPFVTALWSSALGFSGRPTRESFLPVGRHFFPSDRSRCIF